MATICQAVPARARPHIDPFGLRVENYTSPAPIDGDPRLIERLVSNLVANACNHNIVGGHVQISTDTTNGKAVLTVTNTGPIIPANEIDRHPPGEVPTPTGSHELGDSQLAAPSPISNAG